MSLIIQSTDSSSSKQAHGIQLIRKKVFKLYVDKLEKFINDSHNTLSQSNYYENSKVINEFFVFSENRKKLYAQLDHFIRSNMTLDSRYLLDILKPGVVLNDRLTESIILVLSFNDENESICYLTNDKEIIKSSIEKFCQSYSSINFLLGELDAHAFSTIEFRYSVAQLIVKFGHACREQKLITLDKVDRLLKVLLTKVNTNNVIAVKFSKKSATNFLFPMLLAYFKNQSIYYLFLCRISSNKVDFFDEQSCRFESLKMEEFKRKFKAVIIADETTGSHYSIKQAKALSKIKYQKIPEYTKDEKAINVFRRFGILKFPGIFDVRYMTQLSDQIDSIISEQKTISIPVGKGRRLFPLPIQDYLADPQLFANEHVDRILTANLGSKYVINSVNAVSAEVGSDFQHFHSDHPPLFEGVKTPDSQSFAMVLATPLTELNYINGTTRLLFNQKINSTHTLVRERVPIISSLGDSFIYDYSMEHQGVPTIKGRRTILYIVYSRPWFQETTHYRHLMKPFISQDNLQKIEREHKKSFLIHALLNLLQLISKNYSVGFSIYFIRIF